MGNRAERRRHSRRMKAKAMRVYNPSGNGLRFQANAFKYADHLAACSCRDCGNPRKWKWKAGENLTLDERRFKEKADLDETDIAG